MATSNPTLASLWIDDGHTHVIKQEVSENNIEITEDLLQFYKNSGLEGVAKESGVITSGGTLIKSGSSQIISLSSPIKNAQILPKAMIASLPSSNTGSAQIPQRLILQQSPVVSNQTHSWSSGAKRGVAEGEESLEEAKRVRRIEKSAGKGLRHFSMKVCEKVKRKGVTTYNEVADELVSEILEPRQLMANDQQYDQKNIRRRVYDALNVLMAMNIISKDKKEIRWIGLPTNSVQECQNLEKEKQRRLERIQCKTQQLHELVLQQIAFKHLVNRNKLEEQRRGRPSADSAIQLPFIVVNTSKTTVIDCNISNDKSEYLFNFDHIFEIHDDIEVLKRMGMTLGLEDGNCSEEVLQRALTMVPKAVEPYVKELSGRQVKPEVMYVKDEFINQDSNSMDDDDSQSGNLVYDMIAHHSPSSGADSESDRSSPIDLL